MLELLDVAVGFATVMLAVSLIIMSLTQALSSLLALRGARLRTGLQQLIEQTAPSLKASAKELSEAMLTHPLISDASTVLGGRWRWASAIKKEELLPVLDAVLAQRKLPALSQQDERAALQEWFDSFMARVSQWFVMNTRWITVGFALVLSFAMHLDSVQVLKQLREDTETRAKVLSMSASLLDQSPQSVDVVERRYTEALKELVRSQPAKLNAGVNESSAPRITTRSEAINWLGTNGKPEEKDGLITAYNESVDKMLSETLDKSIDRAKTLQASLTSAGIALYPPGHNWHDWLDLTSPHFWGMVASVLFLSLGAPFWFNLLKNMTSLKSVVATKEEAAKGGAQAGGRERALVQAAPQALPPIPSASSRPPGQRPAQGG